MTVTRKKRQRAAAQIAKEVVESTQKASRKMERICFGTTPQGRVMFEVLAKLEGRTMATMVAMLAHQAAVSALLSLEPADSEKALKAYILGCNEAGFPAALDGLVEARRVDE